MDAQDFRSLQEAYLEVVENQQLDEMPYQVMGSPDGKKEKKIGKPVKSRKYADARAAELEDTHEKTGGKYRSQYVESYDLYDIILSHLLDEGYAETVEAAEVIMVNMSEEWRESIVEAVQIPPIKPQRYIAPSRPIPAPTSSTPRPDMSTPADKKIGQKISQTPAGMRLTGPTGPLR